MSIPEQQFLDRFTRQDELMIQQIGLLQQIITALGATPTLTTDLVEKKKQLETGQYVPYAVKTYDMTTAQTDMPVIFQGDNLLAVSDGSLSGVYVKFNNQNNDALPVQYFTGKTIPFSKLFLTWSAQPAKHLYIAVGRQGEAEFDLTGYGNKNIGAGKATMYNAAFGVVAAGGTFYTSWLNLVAGQRAAILITNTLDVAVTFNTIGNITDVVLPAGGFVYKALAVVAIALTGIKEVGISDVYWDPYIAGELTIPVGASAGSLLIEAVVQG
jgi:hypothetical protein